MATGKVIWYNDDKGYGFIEDSKGKKYFAHFSEIVSDSPKKKLSPNQRVKFEISPKDPDLATLPAKNIVAET